MRFAYEGFTDIGNDRCFRFSGTNGKDSSVGFSVEVKLLLFSENRILVQEGPSFCLHLLETASAADPANMERFKQYTVVNEDFRPMVVERARKLAERAHKAPRKPIRKPAPTSGLVLNIRPNPIGAYGAVAAYDPKKA